VAIYEMTNWVEGETTNTQILNTYIPAWDANGNIIALINAADKTVAARYEYGVFGELLRASGPMAQKNPLRFSTKFQDNETGLLYYGYRYYNPETGRWPSRDPIGEKGGLNLYGFCGNNPLMDFDPDGRYDVKFITLPPVDLGKTEFDPVIKVTAVKVNFCCCSLVSATWAANTHVLINISANVPGVGAHEAVHAITDDAVAAKALPVAIIYLQSICTKKGFLSEVFTGPDWTQSSCMSKMRSEADAAASYINDLANGMLQDKAHSFIGAYGNTWNPNGIALYDVWFKSWLAGQFNGGKYW
jgi:RHS repeat-associated protein